MSKPNSGIVTLRAENPQDFYDTVARTNDRGGNRKRGGWKTAAWQPAAGSALAVTQQLGCDSTPKNLGSNLRHVTSFAN